MIDDERVPSERIELCYNGVDTAQFYPEAALKPEPVANASLVIGSVCVLRPEKALDLLLEAFARVRHLKPSMKLLIVGSGPELPSLEANSRRLGLQGDCEFVPATRLVAQFLRAALYPPGHPYHNLTIGTPQDLDAATLDDVKAFFRTWYVPNNATLVIAGDIDKAATRELVDKYFGPIPQGKLPDRASQASPQVVPLTGEQRLEVAAGVELPRVYMAWPTPPALTADRHPR